MIKQECAIYTKPDSPGNTPANSTIETIHKVLGDIVRTYNLYDAYVDDAYPCMVIFATSYIWQALRMMTYVVTIS